MPKEGPLAVDVPAPDRDKPGWVKVGVIAAVGFIIGIAWPRLMGVRLGPAAPGESAAAAASASASAQGGRAPDAPPASVVAKGPAAANAATPAAPASAGAATTAEPASGVAASAGAPNISIQKGSVLSCKTSDGDTKKGKECGSVPGIDRLVQPRVRKLASCQGAQGQSGKLSLVVTADFAANKLSYDIGKSSTLSNTDALSSCLKSAFDGTSTKDARHEHPRYTVAYSAIFAPSAGDDDKLASKKGDKDRSEKSAKEAPDEKEETSAKAEKAATPALASGEAQVAWEVALVRDTPKTGGLVARLPRGSKVKVGAAKDGWFQVKFGEGYAHEGWVYRGAIGR